MRKATILQCLAYALLIAPPSSLAQHRCAQCILKTCATGFNGYTCLTGLQHTTCTLSNLQAGCYLSCQENLGCTGASDLQACNDLGSMNPESIKAFLKPAAVRESQTLSTPTQQDNKELSDDENQAQLLKMGASAIKMDDQTRTAPASLVNATHSATDLLEASRVLNVNPKVITALRVGWLVKAPGVSPENHETEWVSFPKGLQPYSLAEIPSQHIDPTYVSIIGTLVRMYVAEVKFEDGETWVKTPEKAPSKPAQMSTYAPSDDAASLRGGK